MNGITHHLKLQDVDLWALSDAWAAARAPGVPGAQREHSGSTAGAQREHSGSTAGAQREHSGSTAGAQREHRVGRPAIGSLVELQAMGI